MIYLYAIVDGLDDVQLLRGIEGESLVVFEFDHVHVIAGEIHTVPAITRELLTSQDQIVRALHERAAALLPMRFGAAFRSREEAERAVALHVVGLRERLDRVRQREQMTMRVAAASAVARQDEHASFGETLLEGSGAAYLRQRARPREIAPLLDAVAPVVRATTVERGKAASVMSVYQLIDRGTSGEYHRRVDVAAREQTALTVHVSGPSPCYAFT